MAQDRVTLVDDILGANEEAKKNGDLQDGDAQNNDELFKHLSYLSQIRNDADKDSILEQE